MKSERADSAKITICGAGGSGIPLLWGLLVGSDSAGVSEPETQAALRKTNQTLIEITLVDPDRITLSNLNRQILFTPADIGELKAPLLSRRVLELFPESAEWVTVGAISEALTVENIEQLLASSNLVIDCTDSVATKLLINDYCTFRKKSFCYTGVVGDHGQLLFVNHRAGAPVACLRCLFDGYTDSDYLAQARSCRSAGIFGSVAGAVGFLAAEHSLRFLRSSDPTCSQLVRTSLDHPFPRYTDILPSANCPLGCGQKRLISLDLTDLRCPSTFLYTKLALERLNSGDTLDVRFQNRDSVERVAEGCEDLGYYIVSPGRQISESLWRLLLRHP